jgi:hypothetical protein
MTADFSQVKICQILRTIVTGNDLLYPHRLAARAMLLLDLEAPEHPYVPGDHG